MCWSLRDAAPFVAAGFGFSPEATNLMCWSLRAKELRHDAILAAPAATNLMCWSLRAQVRRRVNRGRVRSDQFDVLVAAGRSSQYFDERKARRRGNEEHLGQLRRRQNN